MRKALVIILMIVPLAAIAVAMLSSAYYARAKQTSIDPTVVRMIVEDNKSMLEQKALNHPNVARILKIFKAKPHMGKMRIVDLKKVSDNEYIADIEMSVSPALVVVAKARIDIEKRAAALVGEPFVTRNMTRMSQVFSESEAGMRKAQEWLVENSNILREIIYSREILEALKENNVSAEWVISEALKLAKQHSLTVSFGFNPATGEIKYYTIIVRVVQVEQGNKTQWVVLSNNIEQAFMLDLPKTCQKIIDIMMYVKETEQSFKMLRYRYMVNPCIYSSPAIIRGESSSLSDG